MLGAIAGDIIGSPYERTGSRIKKKDFPLFSPNSRYTDDTVLTVAVADALMHRIPYEKAYRDYYRRYPDAGYGPGFISWARDPNSIPYGSFGNGSAMRVSPVAWMFSTLEEVLSAARESAIPTHNHPEGIAGAQATAAAIFMARTGSTKEHIREYISSTFKYDLSRTVDSIRPSYVFSSRCGDSVPEAIIAFLDARSFEDAVRNAVSLGGDSDTQAAIAGSIAEPFYGIPPSLEEKILSMLDGFLSEKVMEFRMTY